MPATPEKKKKEKFNKDVGDKYGRNKYTLYIVCG